MDVLVDVLLLNFFMCYFIVESTHAQVMHVTCKTCVQIRWCTEDMTFEQSKMQNDGRVVALEIGDFSTTRE
jgi:hypothetical protein